MDSVKTYANEKKTARSELYIEPVKEVISRWLILHEKGEVFKDFLFHLDSIVVTDGVFPKEIKFYYSLLTV